MPCLWAWSGSSWFNVPRPVIGRLPALFRSSQGPLRVALWGSYSTPTPPPPLLKKSGENQLINFSGFPAKCAGGPLIGSGPLVLFARSCSGRTNAFSGEAENPGVSGGGGGRAQSALKERARGQRPRARSFVWRPRGAFGPPGPAKPKSPGRGLGIFRARSAPPPPPRGGWGATGGKKGSSRPSWRPKPTARGLQPLVAEKTTMVSSMQPDSVIP